MRLELRFQVESVVVGVLRERELEPQPMERLL
jgi:hypothetical protein